MQCDGVVCVCVPSNWMIWVMVVYVCVCVMPGRVLWLQCVSCVLCSCGLLDGSAMVLGGGLTE